MLDNHGHTVFLNDRDTVVSRVPRLLPATGVAVVSLARNFLGLPYLWAGTSGFGYDCSGFVHDLHAALGVQIPRDSDAQADAAGDPRWTGGHLTGSASGTWLPKLTDLLPGDLLFYAGSSGAIDHVGIFSGRRDGQPMMIDAPNTGGVVEEVRINADGSYGTKHFVGGGRFLTSPVDPITAKWGALGGTASLLGAATSPVLTVAGGLAQHFAGGDIYWSATTGAHEVHGAILARHLAMGGPNGTLGFPSTDETSTPDRIGRYNHFSRSGSIYWTPSTGAHAIYGAIRGKWAALGWERGALGYPTTSEYVTPGGRRNDFQHGSIAWIAATGALQVVYR